MASFGEVAVKTFINATKQFLHGGVELNISDAKPNYELTLL